MISGDRQGSQRPVDANISAVWSPHLPRTIETLSARLQIGLKATRTFSTLGGPALSLGELRDHGDHGR